MGLLDSFLDNVKDAAQAFGSAKSLKEQKADRVQILAEVADEYRLKYREDYPADTVIGPWSSELGGPGDRLENLAGQVTILEGKLPGGLEGELVHVFKDLGAFGGQPGSGSWFRELIRGDVPEADAVSSSLLIASGIGSGAVSGYYRGVSAQANGFFDRELARLKLDDRDFDKRYELYCGAGDEERFRALLVPEFANWLMTDVPDGTTFELLDGRESVFRQINSMQDKRSLLATCEAASRFADELRRVAGER